MLGAEDVVAACGGVAEVLAAVGVDMHRAVRGGLGIRGSSEPSTSAVAGSEGGRTCISVADRSANELDTSVAAFSPVKERMDQHCPSDQPHSRPKILAPDARELRSAAPSQQQRQRQCVDSARQQQAKQQQQQPSAESVQQQEQSQQLLVPQPLPLPAQPQPQQQERLGPQAVSPVVFCLEDYEHVHARLLQASQLTGLMLLSSAGMIPPKTLQSAR